MSENYQKSVAELASETRGSARIAEKEAMRKKLDEDVKKFLSGGGQIKNLDSGKSKC